MALIRRGADVVAQHDITANDIGLHEIDDPALPTRGVQGAVVARMRDLDGKAAVDADAGARVRQRLHAVVGPADRAVVRQVGAVARKHRQLVRDGVLLKVLGRVGGVDVALEIPRHLYVVDALRMRGFHGLDFLY